MSIIETSKSPDYCMAIDALQTSRGSKYQLNYKPFNQLWYSAYNINYDNSGTKIMTEPTNIWLEISPTSWDSFMIWAKWPIT